MRGGWAAAAVGSSVAKNKAQAAAQQQPNTALQQTGQEEITQKLQKLANLKQQGMISEEEYQKIKADLLAKLQ